MKRNRYIISAIVVFVMICNLVATLNVSAASISFAGGKGTVEEPYLISTKEQLYAIRNKLNSHYKLTNDIAFVEEDFNSGGAFYNGGYGWEPIGENDSSPFTGTFDGNGFTISGINISIEEYPYMYIICTGLFGYNKGTIANLTLSDCNFSTTIYREAEYSHLNYLYSGYISGYNSGSIDNCNINNSVLYSKHMYDTENPYYINVGGITGYNSGYVGNCINNGSVESDAFTKAVHTIYTGGIVGLNTGKIYNCSNTNAVKSTPESASASSSIGGIVGSTSGFVMHCNNSGSINVKSLITSGSYSATARAGGIAGYTSSGATISKCYNNGSINSEASASRSTSLGTATSSASSSAYCYAGGIVGDNSSGTIDSCYNTSSVYGYSYSYGANARAQVFSGGIAGQSYGNISKSFNTGTISKSASSTRNPVSYMGGIVAAIYNKGAVSNCYYKSNASTGIGSGNTSGTAVACTSDQLKQKDTFSLFDFIDTWVMGTNHPELKSYVINKPLIDKVDNTAIITIMLNNKDLKYNEASIIVVGYSNNGQMTFCAPKSLKHYESHIDIPFTIDETNYIKVLLWENLTTIRPLCECAELNIE